MSGTSLPLRVPYKTVYGTDIPTDIFVPDRPLQDDSGLTPVIIMFHGGGFMLGQAKMNNKDQINDCMSRGWIVMSVEYRLCPGVDVLEGPMADARDALKWAQIGGLASVLKEAYSERVLPDPKRIMAMGTSAGGHLALSLGWGTANRPLAILDFYGAKNFKDNFWHQTIEQIRTKLPSLTPASDPIFQSLYQEKATFIGGASLEGQNEGGASGSPSAPDFSDPRQLFILNMIAQGQVVESIWPSAPNDLHLIDPVLNVHADWPPTAFVHGTKDFMIPIEMSQYMETQLRSAGVETALFPVPDEPHTFVGQMLKGSLTWHKQREGFDFLDRILKRSYL